MQVNNAKAVGEAARELDMAVVVGAWVFLNADHTHTLEKAEPVATVKTAVRSARMHRKMWECGARRLRKPRRGERCDGWFASLLRDPHHARYVILVFIQGRGLGGGLAARTAASTAQFLAAQEQSSATKSRH